MNRLLIQTVALALSLAGGTATAQTEPVPHTFEAGTPARAAEVNENFSAVAGAVDDNVQDIAVNAATIDTLAVEVAELQASAPDWVVLDFSKPNACVIDQSGYYVLDRSWASFGQSAEEITCDAPGEGVVSINAQNVTLDLRGFFISFNDDELFFGTIIVVESGMVTIRNGGVHTLNGRGILALGSARVRLENITSDAVALEDNSYVINSRFFCDLDKETAALSVGANSKSAERPQVQEARCAV